MPHYSIGQDDGGFCFAKEWYAYCYMNSTPGLFGTRDMWVELKSYLCYDWSIYWSTQTFWTCNLFTCNQHVLSLRRVKMKKYFLGLWGFYYYQVSQQHKRISWKMSDSRSMILLRFPKTILVGMCLSRMGIQRQSYNIDFDSKTSSPADPLEIGLCLTKVDGTSFEELETYYNNREPPEAYLKYLLRGQRIGTICFYNKRRIVW